MSRGGKMLKRRKDHSLFGKTGKTGSHRNGGAGFSRIPIAGREHEGDKAPIAVGYRPTTAPDCDNDHPMQLVAGKARQFFWTCYRCRTAIAYKPLRTGLKQSA